MSTPLTTPTRRPLRSLLALAAAATALGAQAVPVTVSISGLPPGLSPVVDVQRNVCPDGMGWVSNPSQALVESSVTTYEMVTLSTGQVTLRSKVVTRYSASFDTPATPSLATRTQPWDIRCSEVGTNADLFSFTLKVPGVSAGGQPTHALAGLGTTPQSGTLTVSRTMSARTTSFTPAVSVLTRNVPVTMEAGYVTSIGTLQGQRLDFLRPSTLFLGSFTRVASVFLRDGDNAACVQAGSTTRCLSGGTPAEAGGVRLRSLTRSASGAAQFQFELLSTFPIGTLKLRANADASDLAEYIVDGTPQVLDLLPMAPLEQTVTVQ